MSESKKTRVGPWALLLKLGPKVGSIFMKLLKGLKVIKVGLAAATFVAYAAIFSWKFALLIMLSIGFHESGHVWAMKRMGIKTKGFYFLPFIGGAAVAESDYKTYGANAFVAVMGPVWGCALAWATGGLYLMTGNPFFAAAAGWMAMINLFNLLPVSPLDGGQLVRSIAFSIHQWAGLFFMVLFIAASVFLLFHFHIGLFAFLLIIGGLEVVFEFRTRIALWKYNKGLLSKWYLPHSAFEADGSVSKFPDAMSGGQLALTVGSYVGTTVVLIVLMLLMKHVPGADIAANFME